MNKIIWNQSQSTSLLSNTALRSANVPNVITLEDNVTDKVMTVNQAKAKYDIKSFGLWTQDIPNIAELQIGDTFTVPHFTYRKYSNDKLKATSQTFEVLDKRTFKRTSEVFDSSSKKVYTKTTHKTFIQIQSESKYGADNLFERCAPFSARKNGGYYYPLQKRKTFWLDQTDVFTLFLKDGGLCPLLRRKLECDICS